MVEQTPIKRQKGIFRDFETTPFFPTPMLSPVTPKGILEIECQLMSPTRRFFKSPKSPFTGEITENSVMCANDLVVIMLSEFTAETTTAETLQVHDSSLPILESRACIGWLPSAALPGARMPLQADADSNPSGVPPLEQFVANGVIAPSRFLGAVVAGPSLPSSSDFQCS